MKEAKKFADEARSALWCWIRGEESDEREDIDNLTQFIKSIQEDAVAQSGIDAAPELKGTFPVVLYFDTRKDADEFLNAVKDLKTNLKERKF